MSGLFTHRRDALAMLAGGAMAAAARPVLAAAPMPREVRVMRGVAFERAVVPPAMMQQMTEYERSLKLAQPVLDRADAPEIRRYREFLDKEVKHEPVKLRKVEKINHYVNHNAKQLPDEDLHMRTDVWTPPLHTLLAGGDCEDLALCKRWGLRRVGFDWHDMYLVGGVTRMAGKPTFHAVLVLIFRPDGAFLLDSLSDPVYDTKEAAKFEPVYALNQYGFWRVVDPAPEEKPYWDALGVALQPVRL